MSSTQVNDTLPVWVPHHLLFGGKGQAYLTSVEEGLSRLRKLPVLFVWGDADFSTTVDRELERFRQIFLNHQVAILSGAGHWYQEDAPDETIHAVRAWWSNVVNPSSNE